MPSIEKAARDGTLTSILLLTSQPVGSAVPNSLQLKRPHVAAVMSDAWDAPLVELQQSLAADLRTRLNSLRRLRGFVRGPVRRTFGISRWTTPSACPFFWPCA